MSTSGTSAALVHVVDDDLSVREAVNSLLRSMGLRVRTYASAADFREQWTEPSPGPECLVLDVRMPGLSGLELQRQLGPLQQRLPIVFITAHGDIPMTVRAMKAGAIEFLPKPFRDQDLLDAIQASLARSGDALRDHETCRPGSAPSLRASARCSNCWPRACATSRRPTSWASPR